MAITNMSEQDYRALSAISASDLAAILKCPAKWRFGEKKETPAMQKGTAAHACLLEPEKFAAQYYKIPSADDYEPKALDTATEIKGFLASVGVKAPSAANKPELVALAVEHGGVVLDYEIQKAESANLGKTGLSKKDYEMVSSMSCTIYAQDEYKKMLTGAAVEVSITDIERLGVKVKARLDIVTKNGELWDYKTTTDASPGAFGRAAANYDYWLKMAFYHDMHTAAYGAPPARTVLLAQEKDPPFLCQAYRMTNAQIEAGRTAYKMALGIYTRCMESDNWPAFGGGVLELETPNFLKI
jgi:hypothetical protein